MSDLIPGDPIRTLINEAKALVDQAKEKINGSEEHAPLKTVAYVDLEKYTGVWYELARLPQPYQSNDAVSRVEYGINDDGSVSVHNYSLKGDDDERSIEGSAVPAEGAEQSHARLVVTFGGLASLAKPDPEGNYWILKLDDDYEMALVGTPDRDSLWLLARTPKDWHTHQAAEYLIWAGQNGFDLEKLLVDDWPTNTTSPYAQH